MKKLFAMLLAGALCCGALFGCSNKLDNDATPQNPLANQTQNANTRSQGGEQTALHPGDTSALQGGSEGMLDLTTLSSTMVYAEVYNMMQTPQSYIGRTIKMDGTYYASQDPGTGMYYHFVVIQDATACCAQGLEFIVGGEYVYPVDYPAEDAFVEVTGVWDSYVENGTTYYFIATDGISVL